MLVVLGIIYLPEKEEKEEEDDDDEWNHYYVSVSSSIY